MGGRKVKEAIHIKQQGPTMNRDTNHQQPDPSVGIWLEPQATTNAWSRPVEAGWNVAHSFHTPLQSKLIFL